MLAKKKLTMVSDIVCPWCIIGYLRLQKACNELELEEQIEIEFAPFALNPSIDDEGRLTAENLKIKYDLDLPSCDSFYANIKALASELGYDFNITTKSKTYSTDKAHLLLEYAKGEGKQVQLKEALFTAYFTHNQKITDPVILLNLADTIGLKRDGAQAALNDNSLAKKVEEEKTHWRQQGVSAVPTIFVDGEISLVGCQSMDEYKKLLTSF